MDVGPGNSDGRNPCCTKIVVLAAVSATNTDNSQSSTIDPVAVSLHATYRPSSEIDSPPDRTVLVITDVARDGTCAVGTTVNAFVGDDPSALLADTVTEYV
ncbi:MAG: hypothetical protein ACK5MT_09705 [Actinomycetales bacterium]